MSSDAITADQIFAAKSVDIVDLIGRRVKLVRKGRVMWGCCPFHKEKSPSFKVENERRTYKCFGCGKGGDAIRWLMEAEGLSFPDSVERLASGVPSLSSVLIAEPSPAPDLSNRIGRALRVWNEAGALHGTIAETYLLHRVGRAIDWPEDLRSHPRCARKINDRVEYHPAVIALLRDIDTNEPRAIQRIFLRPNGSDRLRDASGKMTLGPAAGCACKLSADSSVTTGLGITEGVEKGLALLAAGWSPIWSTNGTSGMSSFPALSGIETLTIFADADMPGQSAAKHCASRWNDAGATVRIATPKIEGADWGDALEAAA